MDRLPLNSLFSNKDQRRKGGASATLQNPATDAKVIEFTETARQKRSSASRSFDELLERQVLLRQLHDRGFQKVRQRFRHLPEIKDRRQGSSGVAHSKYEHSGVAMKKFYSCIFLKIRGGPAEADGRLSVGDEITTVNGQDIIEAKILEIFELIKVSPRVGRVRCQNSFYCIDVLNFTINNPGFDRFVDLMN